MFTKEAVSAEFQQIQNEICHLLEAADGAGKFEEDRWEREGGGGGITRIMQNGALIERGGVNFSAVHGSLPGTVKKALGVTEDEFFATGISIVLHPSNPWVPIIHMNIRYFEMNEAVRWFGGGIDLTPHYVIPGDALYFHQALKKVCDQFNPAFYPEFKDWADQYFYIRHREETRGIGGIFYDKLSPEKTGNTWQELFNFSKQLARSFAPLYTTLATRNRGKAFTDREKQWQLQRRSRYAEFNLVYDSGTRFGLETSGRIESILMSMPPQANWVYNFKPEPGSGEEETLKLLRKGIDWTGG